MNRVGKKDIIFWIILVIIGITIGFFLIQRDRNKGFGSISYGVLPSFKLIDNEGNIKTKRDFKNKVWVAHFVPPNCDQACAQFIEFTDSFNKKYTNRKKFHAVSIFISHKKQKQTPRYPHHLTGKDLEVLFLLKDGFHLKLSEITGSRFILIDQNAVIRGYYSLDEEGKLEELKSDLEKLL
ncbi:hypothetical protein MNBD_UNCLBAC01-1786 [hydrothermal vent metagenome]|uniref:Thioredoxin domain-containing protein n=1 Tax=hydrothermal vent metagenome TaxID=652676 RepID=A0A3B1D2Q8_9ZZZZ